MDAVIVPVKQDGKKRLKSVLSPHEREQLTLAMLRDVLDAASSYATFVVTGADESKAEARSRGCALIDDAGLGLNRALVDATRVALSEGATAVLILPADVPLVQSTDVAKLFSTGSPVAVAPSSDGGTSALLRRTPTLISPRFGPQSARAHLVAAEEAGLEGAVVELDRLRLDVDLPSDMAALARCGSDCESRALAAELCAGRRRAGRL